MNGTPFTLWFGDRPICIIHLLLDSGRRIQDITVFKDILYKTGLTKLTKKSLFHSKFQCIYVQFFAPFVDCDEHRALVHSRGIGPFARRRLNLLLRATLQSVVHSQCFSRTTNEKKEVDKSFSVKWPLNS